MNNTEYNNKLEDLQEQAERHIRDMEDIHRRLIAFLTSELVKGVDVSVKHMLHTRPEKFTALGAQGVAELKSQVTQFKSEIPDLVKEGMSKTAWPHLTGAATTDRSIATYATAGVGVYTEQTLRSVLLRIQMGLGNILTKSDVILSSETASSTTFEGLFTWTEGIYVMDSQYIEQCKKMRKVLGDISTLKGSKATEDAQNLWDSAS